MKKLFSNRRFAFWVPMAISFMVIAAALHSLVPPSQLILILNSLIAITLLAETFADFSESNRLATFKSSLKLSRALVVLLMLFANVLVAFINGEKEKAIDNSQQNFQLATMKMFAHDSKELRKLRDEFKVDKAREQFHDSHVK